MWRISWCWVKITCQQLFILPEPISHLQGNPVLELLVEANVLVFEKGIQRAAQSQLHHQDLRSRAGCQQGHQAGVTEAAQND